MPPQPISATATFSLAETCFFSSAMASPAAHAAEVPRNARRFNAVMMVLPSSRLNDAGLPWKFCDADIAETEIGCWIMPLQADRAFPEFATRAGVVTLRP